MKKFGTDVIPIEKQSKRIKRINFCWCRIFDWRHPIFNQSKGQNGVQLLSSKMKPKFSLGIFDQLLSFKPISYEKGGELATPNVSTSSPKNESTWMQKSGNNFQQPTNFSEVGFWVFETHSGLRACGLHWDGWPCISSRFSRSAILGRSSPPKSIPMISLWRLYYY